jgi:hypothetical protein
MNNGRSKKQTTTAKAFTVTADGDSEIRWTVIARTALDAARTVAAEIRNLGLEADRVVLTATAGKGYSINYPVRLS